MHCTIEEQDGVFSIYTSYNGIPLDLAIALNRYAGEAGYIYWIPPGEIGETRYCTEEARDRIRAKEEAGG